jgi:hypothetical protein
MQADLARLQDCEPLAIQATRCSRVGCTDSSPYASRAQSIHSQLHSHSLQSKSRTSHLSVRLMPNVSAIPQVLLKIRYYILSCFSHFQPCSPATKPSLHTRGHKPLTLPVVLHWCEPWSLTLREEHRLRGGTPVA